MIHPFPKLLYFSLNPSRSAAFWKWVGVGTSRSLCYAGESRFSPAECPQPVHAADLSAFLGAYQEDFQGLHVVLDMSSIPAWQAGIVRDAIISYPEVQFVFDSVSGAFLQALFPERELEDRIRSRTDAPAVRERWAAVLADVVCPLLEVDWEQSEQEDERIVSRIICGMDNSFDASLLRYAVKYWKYLELKVDETRNYSRLQDTRRSSLAFCVEQQSLHNFRCSYALYANGYRVLPVTTLQELESISAAPFPCARGVVIRAFDLQFQDEGGASVDEIRGFKFCTPEELAAPRRGRYAAAYRPGWNNLTDSFEGHANRYWKAFSDAGIPVYYVTHAPEHASLGEATGGIRISDDGRMLTLPGISVPFCGIHHSFQKIPQIGETFSRTRYTPQDPDYKIVTARKDHDHSTPLNVYETACAIIRRAERYYSQGRYLLSALLAGEAIEYMNGFHHRQTVKAYCILSKAENALAMEVVGGNTHELSSDTAFRISKIRQDIARFYCLEVNNSSENTLSQIFSDCRQTCKEREHFESEDLFISAMGHQLEGYSPGRMFNDLKKWFRHGR